jgi:NADH dehydrogenase FAD-containing subunit
VQTGEGSRQIDYDYLIYALGSTIERDGVPGVREHAHVLTPSGELSVESLQDTLPALNAAGGTLLICGGGATGIEAAAEFAESFPNIRVRLVTRGGLGMFLNSKIGMYMRRSLERLGVTIQDQTTIAEVRTNEAVTSSGEVIPFDVCLWTGGFTVPPLARDAGLRVNESGQIVIDPFMRSISHPDIFAAGDAAHPLEEPGVPVRMSAFASLVMGGHVAACVSDTLKGKTPQLLSFAYYGQAIALGRHDAIGFNIYPADKPTAPYITGRAGYLFREFFASFASAVPRLERHLPGIFNWVGRGRYAAAKRKAERLGQVRQSL